LFAKNGFEMKWLILFVKPELLIAVLAEQ